VRSVLLGEYRADTPILRDLLRLVAMNGLLLDLPVEEPAVITDLDTPADLARWAPKILRS
jgi:hypothetical protein